jgi:hypothetical protein
MFVGLASLFWPATARAQTPEVSNVQVSLSGTVANITYVLSGICANREVRSHV